MARNDATAGTTLALLASVGLVNPYEARIDPDVLGVDHERGAPKLLESAANAGRVRAIAKDAGVLPDWLGSDEDGAAR